jgi:hypothetical protein
VICRTKDLSATVGTHESEYAPALVDPHRPAGSPLIVADAAETRICVLPVAGFVIAIFAIHEGRETWEGELVEVDDRDDADHAPGAAATGRPAGGGGR